MKEHIEALQNLLSFDTLEPDEEAACRYAIEIMNAAKSLDPAADLERCKQVAMTICPPFEFGDADRVSAAEALMQALAQARGQARAEGYAAGYDAKCADISDASYRCGFDAGSEKEHAESVALETKLSAAQAEIERCNATIVEMTKVGHSAETKLTNLRAYAVRYLGRKDLISAETEFRRAIVESEDESMRHNDQETAELSQDVIALSRELAALKREHKQLRAAALPYATEIFNTGDELRTRERLALRAALDATPAEPVRETSGISTAWVLNQLAGMSFPEQGGAYDFMARCLKSSEEPDEEEQPVRETFEAQAVRELLVRSEVAAEVLRTRAGFLEQACRVLRDSERKP